MLSLPRKFDRQFVDGFTLYELMIVVAIIGVLAGIALPRFISYRYEAYNASAETDAKSIFTAAQIYFTDNPTGEITALGQLVQYGYIQGKDIETDIVSGKYNNLKIRVNHSASDEMYSIDSAGIIAEYHKP